MLGELYWYIHQDPPPDDAVSNSETLDYLAACHKLFENGFLSHDKVCNNDSSVIRNINEGFEYFSSWLSSLLDDGTYIIGDFMFKSSCFRSELPSYFCITAVFYFMAK